VYYAATIDDALEYGGFDDLAIYKAVSMPGPDRPLRAIELDRDDMLKVWQQFRDMPNRPHY